MLMCNSCLEMPFLPSRHSDPDTPDAWGQSSKSDRSTGTIPPRRLTPPPLSLSDLVHLRISLVSSARRFRFELPQAGSARYSLAVDGSDLAAPFPAVYRNRISASTSIPTTIFVFGSGSIRLGPARPWLDPFGRQPAALGYRRKNEGLEEEEEEKGIEKEKRESIKRRKSKRNPASRLWLTTGLPNPRILDSSQYPRHASSPDLGRSSFLTLLRHYFLGPRRPQQENKTDKNKHKT